MCSHLKMKPVDKVEFSGDKVDMFGGYCEECQTVVVKGMLFKASHGITKEEGSESKKE